MATITDSAQIYSSIATDFSNKDTLQKTITIPAQAGKQIQIDTLSLSMYVMATGVTGTAQVVVNNDGITTLATWTETSLKPVGKSCKPAFKGTVGKALNLKWYIKTSDPKTRAKMTLLSCTYSYVDLATTTANDTKKDNTATPCLVVVECSSESSAESLMSTLKDSGAKVYIKKEN